VRFVRGELGLLFGDVDAMEKTTSYYVRCVED
jgi:hypothetical protein